MKYTVNSIHPTQQKVDTVLVGVYNKKIMTPTLAQFDEATQGKLKKLIASGDINTELGKTTLLHQLPNLPFDRLIIVGCGKERALKAREFRKVANNAMKRLYDSASKNALSCLGEIAVDNRNVNWTVRQSILLLEAICYAFSSYKKVNGESKHFLKNLAFHVDSKRQVGLAELAAREAEAIAHGMNLTRDLGNLPANVCTPTYLANQAKKLSKQFPKIKTTIYSEAQLKKMGMGAFLSVAKGSHEPAKMIVSEYQGTAKSKKPIVLVGKGITFDSGGISIKPAANMDEMKYDMCGSASVLGTLRAIAEIGLPLNVVGIIASTENLPGGAASKPGDIVTSMSKQTIEILNTDAEGRLVLCDALTFAEKFKPEIVIDIATLTGAMVVALGHYPTGLLSNDDALVHDLIEAGEESFDRFWQLPLWEEYSDSLESNFADMANVGGRYGGGITAASFLSRFTQNFRWAHLDIAGTAWISGKDKGATGRPVAALTQYLLNRVNK